MFLPSAKPDENPMLVAHSLSRCNAILFILERCVPLEPAGMAHGAL